MKKASEFIIENEQWFNSKPLKLADLKDRFDKEKIYVLLGILGRTSNLS